MDKLDIDKLKNETSVLRNLKNKVDKLEISKLETTVVDLNMLSDVVTNDVVKNTECYVAVKKINDIKVTDTSSLI